MNRLKKHLFAPLCALLLAAGCTSEEPEGVSVGSLRELNEWVFSYMKSHYLWNEAVAAMNRPDCSLGYEEFLDRVLRGVAAQGDVNRDDGHWRNGVRESFYSNITRYPVARTRGTREQATDFGIRYMAVGRLGSEGRYFFQLLSVAPGSPAARAGIRRGDCIVAIDGRPITDPKLSTMLAQATQKQVRLTLADPQGSTLVERGEVTLASASYADNPVWCAKTFTEGGHRVGYLCYNAFNLSYDDDLIAAVADFRRQGVDRLVLDLRYNSGGHVVSSTVLGTLVAGGARKGHVYCRTIYNARRTAAGEKSAVYRIGDSSVGTGSHAPIASALSAALELDEVCVLCTEATASASELVINGLRGLGINVCLVGERTNGKNVGMEPRTRRMGGYEYEFSPVTFYSVNAAGERDYSDGFAPDTPINELDYDVCDWGDPADPLLGAAIARIGGRAAASAPARSASRWEMRPLTPPRRPLDGMIVEGA